MKGEQTMATENWYEKEQREAREARDNERKGFICAKADQAVIDAECALNDIKEAAGNHDPGMMRDLAHELADASEAIKAGIAEGYDEYDNNDEDEE